MRYPHLFKLTTLLCFASFLVDASVIESIRMREACAEEKISAFSNSDPLSRSGNQENRGIMLGYYRSWDSTPLNALPWNHLTHVSHAFAKMDESGMLLKEQRIPSLALTEKAHQHGVKVALAIGGAGSGDQFYQIAKSTKKRKNFINSVIKNVIEYRYDGIDIDWEFPNQESAASFHILLSELKTALSKNQLEKQSLTLSVAIAGSDWHGRWIDSQKLAEHCDFIQIMSYDFTGPWSNHALHHAATNAPPQDLTLGGYSVEHSLDYWINQRSLPANQCLVGLPLYGRLFRATKVGGPVTNSSSTPVEPATLQISKVDELLGKGWRRATARDPWLQSPEGDLLFAFEDAVSIKSKCLAGSKLGCAGAFVWALGDEKLSQQDLVRSAFEIVTRANPE